MTLASVVLAWAVVAASAANVAFWGAALLARYGRRAPPPPLPQAPPAVTLIRPFRGLERDAIEKNLSLVRQDYPRLEVLFVAEDEHDAGMSAAKEACARHLGRGRVLTAPDVGVLSGKVRNMVAGWRESTSPLVAFCDSDILLDEGDVTACVRAMLAERIGASWMPVVCREGGLHGALWLLITAVDGVTAQLAAPHLGVRQTLQGGLMVLRRDVIDTAGGIEQLGDTFADDVRAGNVIQRAGFSLAASERLLLHRSEPEPIASWLPRFHRWTICIRSEAPREFFVQLVMNPVAFPLLAWLLTLGGARASFAAALLAGSVVSRVAGTIFVDHALLRPRGVRIGAHALLRPLADLLFCALSVAALSIPFVRWRGRWYRIGVDGRIASGGSR